LSAFVYIVKCSDGTLYTGWTSDPQRRLAAHNGGTGARYTRGRRPVKLVYCEECGSKEEALSREFRIKKLDRFEKLKLITGKNTASEH